MGNFFNKNNPSNFFLLLWFCNVKWKHKIEFREQSLSWILVKVNRCHHLVKWVIRKGNEGLSKQDSDLGKRVAEIGRSPIMMFKGPTSHSAALSEIRLSFTEFRISKSERSRILGNFPLLTQAWQAVEGTLFFIPGTCQFWNITSLFSRVKDKKDKKR